MLTSREGSAGVGTSSLSLWGGSKKEKFKSGKQDKVHNYPLSFNDVTIHKSISPLNIHTWGRSRVS
jgi:hypothetical protein